MGFRKIAKFDFEMSVCLSVRVEYLNFHSTYFYEVLYLKIY